jgi:hypothetical protein
MSRSNLPGRPRWTRTEAIVGMASLGLFYWGAVAALAGYRQERNDRQRVASCHHGHPSPISLRRPHIVPLPSTDWRGRMVRPEPAWAPYPQPQALGLAYGPARTIPVYEVGRSHVVDGGQRARTVVVPAVVRR